MTESVPNIRSPQYDSAWSAQSPYNSMRSPLVTNYIQQDSMRSPLVTNSIHNQNFGSPMSSIYSPAPGTPMPDVQVPLDYYGMPGTPSCQNFSSPMNIGDNPPASSSTNVLLYSQTEINSAPFMPTTTYNSQFIPISQSGELPIGNQNITSESSFYSVSLTTNNVSSPAFNNMPQQQCISNSVVDVHLNRDYCLSDGAVDSACHPVSSQAYPLVSCEEAKSEEVKKDILSKLVRAVILEETNLSMPESDSEETNVIPIQPPDDVEQYVPNPTTSPPSVLPSKHLKPQNTGCLPVPDIISGTVGSPLTQMDDCIPDCTGSVYMIPGNKEKDHVVIMEKKPIADQQKESAVKIEKSKGGRPKSSYRIKDQTPQHTIPKANEQAVQTSTPQLSQSTTQHSRYLDVTLDCKRLPESQSFVNLNEPNRPQPQSPSVARYQSDADIFTETGETDEEVVHKRIPEKPVEFNEISHDIAVISSVFDKQNSSLGVSTPLSISNLNFQSRLSQSSTGTVIGKQSESIENNMNSGISSNSVVDSNFKLTESVQSSSRSHGGDEETGSVETESSNDEEIDIEGDWDNPWQPETPTISTSMGPPKSVGHEVTISHGNIESLRPQVSPGLAPTKQSIVEASPNNSNTQASYSNPVRHEPTGPMPKSSTISKPTNDNKPIKQPRRVKLVTLSRSVTSKMADTSFQRKHEFYSDSNSSGPPSVKNMKEVCDKYKTPVNTTYESSNDIPESATPTKQKQIKGGNLCKDDMPNYMQYITPPKKRITAQIRRGESLYFEPSQSGKTSEGNVTNNATASAISNSTLLADSKSTNPVRQSPRKTSKVSQLLFTDEEDKEKPKLKKVRGKKRTREETGTQCEVILNISNTRKPSRLHFREKFSFSRTPLIFM